MMEETMKQQFVEILKQILEEMGVTNVVPDVEISDDSTHGDYTTNVAMRLAPMVKKGSDLKGIQGLTLMGKSPMEIALQVKEAISHRTSIIRHEGQDQNRKQKYQKQSPHISANSILQAIDRVEVVPPGFINFFLTEAKLSTSTSSVLSQKKLYGTRQTKSPQRVTVEFTDPNPFKEFHIGHLYSNSVGEALCRLLESQGHAVRRVNYQGDVGMHVAKSLYSLLATFKVEELEKLPLPERVHMLGQAYVAGAEAFEENKKAVEEMKILNGLIFIAAQELAKAQGWKPVVDYRRGEPVDEEKLAVVKKIYEKGRAWSLDYFETIYKRLGTKFEGYYFESQVGERGVAIVRDFMNKGVFEESDGAVVYRGEKNGLHTRVFINQLGLPTYEAKELGLAPTKEKDWPHNLSLIVTGNEINEYFKVLISALTEVSPNLGKKTRHIGHGMVKNADGSKMSSRSGQVLTGGGLVDEVKASIYTIIDTSNQKYNRIEREEIAEKAAVAAVKYSLLKVSLPSDVAFDIAKSVSFEGDSGPYLLYTYARAKSVLRKAERLTSDMKSSSHIGSVKLNLEERAVARLIHFFPEIVDQAAHEYAPNVLCKYLFDLAQAFNLFYQKHAIIGNDYRLALTAATAQVLGNGLYLLGIKTLEQM